MHRASFPKELECLFKDPAKGCDGNSFDLTDFATFSLGSDKAGCKGR